MLPKGKKRTCIICKQRIDNQTSPWMNISPSGEERFWHPECDKEDDRG